MVTIKDIAKTAGVTHSTVSRCLSGSPLVSEATRSRIKALAEEMGYSPNIIARKLVTRRSHTLGLFYLSRDEVSFMENYGTQFLDGVARRSAERGYDLLFFTLTKDLRGHHSYIDLCRQRQVEGAVFIGVASDDPHLEEISRSPLPVSVIDYPIDGPLVGKVGSDSCRGIALALEHFWSQGHTRLGFLTGPPTAPVAVERLECFLKLSMEKHPGWTPPLFKGNFTRASGEAAASHYLELTEKPTAVMAANDLMALGFMQALQSRGLRIPDDVSLIGYDNAVTSGYAQPGLTTVAQPAEDMGAGAVDLVADLIEGKKTDLRKIYVPRLVVRGSVRVLGRQSF